MSIQRTSPLKLAGGLSIAGLGAPNFCPTVVEGIQLQVRTLHDQKADDLEAFVIDLYKQYTKENRLLPIDKLSDSGYLEELKKSGGIPEFGKIMRLAEAAQATEDEYKKTSEFARGVLSKLWVNKTQETFLQLGATSSTFDAWMVLLSRNGLFFCLCFVVRRAITYLAPAFAENTNDSDWPHVIAGLLILVGSTDNMALLACPESGVDPDSGYGYLPDLRVDTACLSHLPANIWNTGALGPVFLVFSLVLSFHFYAASYVLTERQCPVFRVPARDRLRLSDLRCQPLCGTNDSDTDRYCEYSDDSTIQEGP